MPQQELRMKLVAVFTEISFSGGLVSPPPAPMAFVLAMVTYGAAQWQQYVHFLAPSARCEFALRL